jgi:polar amino acid transport system permease protein
MVRILATMPDIIRATGMTLSLTVVSILFGMVLGLLLALGRISKNSFVRGLTWTYIWVFRGTPMLMQIFFLFFVLPKLLPMLTTSAFNTAVIALGLNSAAYLAEIIRAAIQSIDKGQMEAAKALGMNTGLAMRRIIIPQSIRRMLPPVGNEFIMLLKDTSLVSAIGLTELLKIAKQMTSSTGDAIYYLPIAVIYLMLTTIFTFVFEKLEKKYSIYE